MDRGSNSIMSSVLEYDINLPGSDRQLHVVSDPCSHAFAYSIGSSLWQAASEFLEFLSGVYFMCEIRWVLFTCLNEQGHSRNEPW